MNKQIFILSFVFLLLCSFTTAYISDNSLDTFYRFEQGSGINVYDNSENNNNCTLINGIIYDISKGENNTGNYSILLNSSLNQYADCGNIGEFERTDNFSISLWIKTSTLSDVILAKHTGTRGYQLFIASNGVVLFSLDNNAGVNYINRKSSSAINNNIWRHIIVTYNGSSSSSGMNIYIDGILNNGVTSGTLNDTIISGTNFRLGARSNGLYYKGLLDEVAIFSKELNSTEVIDIYNNGITLEANNPPIIEQNILNQKLNLHYDNCIEIKWNVTDDDTLFYNINTTFINISNTTGLISGCYDNNSIGNYSIKVNATDTINQSVYNIFNLEIYYDEFPDILVNYSFHTISDISLYNATITIYFNEVVDVDLNIDGLNFNSIDKYIHTIYLKPLSSDTIYNLNFTATDNSNNTLTKSDTFKTLSFGELEYEQRERNYTLMINIFIIVILIVLYILGELFFPAISVLAGIGFMIFAFAISIFPSWYLKFLFIFIGLFMLAKGVAKFFFGEN